MLDTSWTQPSQLSLYIAEGGGYQTLMLDGKITLYYEFYEFCACL